MYRYLFLIFIISFVTPSICSYAPRYRQNDIQSISISDDGKVIVWDWFYDICIADTKNPKNYNRYSLKNVCEFGAYATKISGNGKTVCFIDDNNLYVSDIRNFKIGKLDKIELSEFGQPRYLSIDYEGNKIIVSIMGKSIQGKCAPGWENAILFSRDKSKWKRSLYIRKTNECEFVSDFRFISKNTIIYKLDSFKDESNLIVKTRIDHNGKWCCENYLNFSANNLLDVNKEGTRFIMSFKKLMKNGDSVLSIFQSQLINDSILSKPQPILGDHKDPIVWGTQLSPRGDKLAWLHLVRGEDGNSIIKKEIRLVEYKESNWSESKIILDMSKNSINAGFFFSDNFIIITDYIDDNRLDDKFAQKNKLYFYTTLDKNGELIEIEQIK